MSEQKVWVEKVPEYCDECPCSLRGKDDCAYCNLLHKNIGYDFGKRPKHCPLQSIKVFKRDFVKEVCEKIIERYNLEGIPITGAFGDTQYGCIMVSAKDLKQFLNQIQKEYEK